MGHVECMEKMRNMGTCLILIIKHQRRILYLMYRSENKIKMDHRVRGCEYVGWIQQVEYKIEHVVSSWLSNHELSKEDLAPLC